MLEKKFKIASIYWKSSRSMLSSIVRFKINTIEMKEQIAKLKEQEHQYKSLIQELSKKEEMLSYAMKLIKSKKKETAVIDKKIALHIILLSEDEALWKKVMDFDRSPEYKQLRRDVGIKRFIYINKEPFTLLSKELSLKFFNFLKAYSPIYTDDIAEVCAYNRWEEYNTEIIEILKKPDPDILGFDKDSLVNELGYFGSEKLMPYLVHELKSKISNDENSAYAVNALLLAGYPKNNFEAFIENNNDQAFHVSTISQYGHPSLLKTYRAQTELWRDQEYRFTNMLSKAISSFRTPLLIDWLKELLCDESEDVREIAHYGIASFLEKDVYDPKRVLQLENNRDKLEVSQESIDKECKRVLDYWESRADEIAQLDKQARYQSNELFDFGKIFSENIYEQFDDCTSLLTWIDSAIIYTGKYDLPYTPYGYGYEQVKQVDAWIEYFNTNPLVKGKWYRYGIDVGNVPAMSQEDLKNRRFL